MHRAKLVSDLLAAVRYIKAYGQPAIDVPTNAPLWQLCKQAAEEIKALQTRLEDLLELARDLRVYTHNWDWKYGTFWDEELAKADKALPEAAEAEGDE